MRRYKNARINTFWVLILMVMFISGCSKSQGVLEENQPLFIGKYSICIDLKKILLYKRDKFSSFKKQTYTKSSQYCHPTGGHAHRWVWQCKYIPSSFHSVEFLPVSLK